MIREALLQPGRQRLGGHGNTSTYVVTMVFPIRGCGNRWEIKTPKIGRLNVLCKTALVLSSKFFVHPSAPDRSLWSRFQDHIERRFRGTAKPRKSALQENLSQAPLTGLRSKGEANFLTERTRSAYHRREPVIHPANR
jgi:hypothetical protein